MLNQNVQFSQYSYSCIFALFKNFCDKLLHREIVRCNKKTDTPSASEKKIHSYCVGITVLII